MAETYRVREQVSGFGVFRGREKIVGALTEAEARERCRDLNKKAEAEARTRDRRCLCCGTVFRSEGPGHRLCDFHRRTIGGLGREMV